MKFKVDHTANATGTYLQEKIEAKYTDLVKLFGEPATTTDDKVAVEWTFVNKSGDVVTLYDWKSNDLSFKTSSKPYIFHIGAKCSSTAWDFFDELLLELLKKD